MLSEIDGMLQSLYMLNNTPVSDARRALVIREMNGNPDVNPEGSDTTTHAVNALDFEVTVKSHKERKIGTDVLQEKNKHKKSIRFACILCGDRRRRRSRIRPCDHTDKG